MKLRKILCGSLMAVLGLSIFSFTSVIAETNGVIEVGKGEEKLYGVFNKVTNATDYNAYVKLSSASNYTKLDDQLVREVNGNIRVDAVGLKAGNYNLKFVPVINSAEDTTKQIELTDIVVGSYDRSGYAHFNYSDGVGAYNDDGTLKTGTKIIYVDDSTKNNVDEDGDGIGDGKTLAQILKGASSYTALDVRILGQVSAATWQQIEYDPTGTYRANKNLPIDNVIGKNNEKLVHASLNESEIISAGYNDLDTSVYTKLEGLTNKINYDSDDNEFDSYYNMLDISSVSNVTVEGIGEDATIFQWGLTWKSCHSIEVRNITFDDYPEDACSFEASGTTSVKSSDTTYNMNSLTAANAWIHNCTFNEGKNYWDVCTEQDKHEGDGATDVKKQKNYTISYNHYYKNHKTGLVGGGSGDPTFNVTYHHNWYHENQSRMPYARQANMHMYNNFYDSNTGTTMQIYAGAYAFIENCYFKDDKKRFELNSKDYQTPAIKSYNNIFDGGKMNNEPTIVSNRASSVSNGNVLSSTFDTNSSLFYYDSSKQKSNVTVMNDASELPTLIPTVAGAGIFSDASYTVVGGDETEDLKEVEYDNTSTATILNENFDNSPEITTLTTSSVPTNPGIYQYVNNNAEVSTDINASITNNSLYLYDNVKDVTLYAYYILGATYNEGVISYKIKVKMPTQNGSWTIASLLGESTNFDIRTDSTKKIGYSLDDGQTVTAVTTDSYTTNTEYELNVKIDYTNQKLTIKIGDDEVNNIGYSQKIKGFKFMTAGGTRSIYINSILIEKEETLKLGYQLGTYTQNDTSYKALRIIGKFNYDDVVIDSSNIDSIVINVELYNSSDVKYNTISATIDNLYTELAVTSNSETVVVAPEVDGQRYYYTVIKGIKNKHTGYHIKATTTITLKNGVVINCTGFDYKLA
ncbi:MAG: hypothetical protein IJS83_02955 [Acholeplasmatales bacterium]|nr:hypothetical protein [Acholeplasmatales bacterium]